MINFKKIRYKNLLSSGNKFTSIDLDRSQTTLIVGDNGAGKSTLLDALCFGLYGKGFRNLKKDLLVNSINQKELIIIIDLFDYCITRRMIQKHYSILMKIMGKNYKLPD